MQFCVICLPVLLHDEYGGAGTLFYDEDILLKAHKEITV